MNEEFLRKLEEQKWPQEFKEKLKIGNLRSNVGIATLWTFKDVVYRDLDPMSYALVGQYYDKQNALEPLMRNCLANPNIRYILVVGNDKAKSKDVLLSFFEKGIENGKVIGTETPIPAEIPIEEVGKLRKNVKVIDLTSQIKNLDSSEEYARVLGDCIRTLPLLEPYDEPKLFPKMALSTEKFPGEEVGFMVRGKTVGETWLKMLREIYDYGEITKMKVTDSTRIRLCVNLMAVVEDEDPEHPKMEPYFRFDESYLKSYYDEICSPHIPEGTIYTYGSRLRGWDVKDGTKIDQIQDIIEYLKPDLKRASAVAQTWIVEDELTRRYLNKDKNSPCIILVQAYAPEGKLHLTVYIRSNDMFRAWPLNAFGLRKLQKIIADGLGLEMGKLTTFSCSAHIYEDNWKDTKDILDKYHKNVNCFWDSRGYYAIQLINGAIKVKHYSADSRLLKEYEGKSAREINDTINSSQHPKDPYHLSYLGEELMKAEIALLLGIEYVQDMPLKLDSFKSGCPADSEDSCSTDSCSV